MSSPMNTGLRLTLRPFASLLALVVGVPASILAFVCAIHAISLLWSAGIVVSLKYFLATGVCAAVAAGARWPRNALTR